MREELSEQGRLTHAAHAFPPHRPWGHPDLVLADAVLEGVISADDAELIGSTRLEDQNLKQAARVRGITHAAARHRRSRAERRLVEYLASGLVPPEEDATAETRSGTPRLGTKGLAISIPQVQNVRDREADPTGDPSRVGARIWNQRTEEVSDAHMVESTPLPERFITSRKENSADPSSNF